MNIIELLDKQRELDTVILERAGIKEYPFKNIKLALLVELGELANEWQGFKHWKKNKTIDREKLVQEWADCFHFALSLENYLKQTKQWILDNIDNIVTKIDALDLDKDIGRAFELAYGCVVNENSILLGIISLGRCLGISLDEIEKAYLDKNKVNHTRQKEGY